MRTYNFIYKITNLINGKIYIGKHSTDNIDDGYMGSGVVIKQAIKKYGKENFSKEILHFCTDEDSLNEAEKHYISEFNSTDNNIGYNLTYGGEGGEPTEYVRLKISESNKGKIAWNKGKKGLQVSWNKGKKGVYSEDVIRVMSEKASIRMTGVKRSIDTCNKMSISQKGKPKPIYNWLTPDGSIREMSINNAKRYHPDWVQIE